MLVLRAPAVSHTASERLAAEALTVSYYQHRVHWRAPDRSVTQTRKLKVNITSCMKAFKPFRRAFSYRKEKLAPISK